MFRTLPQPARTLACTTLLFALACAEGGNPNSSRPAGSAGQGGNGTEPTSKGGTNQGAATGIVVDAGSGGCGASCASTNTALVVAYCGDGLVNQANEICDDGNPVGGDGCTAGCDQVEVGFTCPTPGTPCESNVRCGDGRIGGTETCDYGALGANAACDANCQLQPGWACPVPGLPCMAAQCGDGIIAGTEECEFTTAIPPEGCTNTCRITMGYDCSLTDLSCWLTVCGDKKVERSEQCDDGNTFPFDGCYECRTEPACNSGVCVASCGDGQRFATEDCDDGNTRGGDGCSETCTIETGFTCVDGTMDPALSMAAPVLLRDFVGNGHALSTMTAHKDFNNAGGCPMLGIVGTALNPLDDRPVFSCPNGICSNNPSNCHQSRWDNNTVLFDQWYRNVDGVNIPLAKALTLTRQTDGTYKYDSDNAATAALEPFNFIASEGWVALGLESLAAAATCGTDRNVSFTSETHFWFEYRGGERFDFSGDDDTWVFLNNTLVIDLGGRHERMDGYFILDADTDGAGLADTADGSALWASPEGSRHMNGAPVPATPARLETGLTVGGIYEVVVFQAERYQCESNFGITMRNFSKPRSACDSECGDGVVASTELCDDGTNTATYNGCGPGCLPSPFCGDGVLQSDYEECDDGVNTSLYGGCAPGCKRGPSCGDGLVQAPYEQCDDGTNDGGYAECAPNCQYGERCGDGVRQAEFEECDDGPSNGKTACQRDCTSNVIL